MAAGIAGNVLKIRNEVIREALMDFQGIEHRLETVMKVHGMQFINDSKATNVNSCWYALESVKGEIIWIAGFLKVAVIFQVNRRGQLLSGLFWRTSWESKTLYGLLT